MGGVLQFFSIFSKHRFTRVPLGIIYDVLNPAENKYMNTNQ